MNITEERKLREVYAWFLEERAKNLKEEKSRFKLEANASLQTAYPVLPLQTMEMLTAGLAKIVNAEKWKFWGFDGSNSVLSFSGPPGTGKTTSARWIAKKLKVPMLILGMGEVGGGDPGETERHIKEAFAFCAQNKALVFLDECDAMLWNRERAGSDSMWMLGVINTLLTEIERYPFVVVLATNFPEVLDPAVKRRVLFDIGFQVPEEKIRQKLWFAKWPKWPLKPEKKEICKLATYVLTGSEIEVIIQQEAAYAITQDRSPCFSSIEAKAIAYIQAKSSGKA